RGQLALDLLLQFHDWRAPWIEGHRQRSRSRRRARAARVHAGCRAGESLQSAPALLPGWQRAFYMEERDLVLLSERRRHHGVVVDRRHLVLDAVAASPGERRRREQGGQDQD